ncbi:MAG: GNAT family N-acetyltransferase [Chitinophagaceae bacterium]|nr:GNAT family N-acetyltransferase [Chitinophagaceae bacterium]
MSTNITIRRALPEDAKIISELSEITFRDTYRGSFPESDNEFFIQKCFATDVVANELRDANDFYFIAFADSVPAGYMRLKEDYSDYPAMKRYKALELKRIYVLKEFHSKKIGAALMSFAIHFANQKNFEALWLGVYEHNAIARAFYKKWGFSDTGFVHTFYVGNTGQIDHWLIKFMKAGEHTKDTYP